ncbi:MAG: acyltransferase [Bacteroidetes bacterium]|nr:acyltransferase [Bacteroidota bacterium]
MDRIKTIDSLRFYGALGILFAHFPAFGSSWLAVKLHDVLVYTSAPYLMVELFFCVSGFLITRIIITEKLKGTFHFGKFFFRRSLRIVPLYVLTLLAVGFIFNEDVGMQWQLTYTSNFLYIFKGDFGPLAHTWSLAVEEHFYLIWPLLMCFLSIKTGKLVSGFIIPVIAITFSVFIILATGYDEGGRWLYYGTPSRMLALSVGCYLAFIEKDIIAMAKWKFAILIAVGLGLFSVNVYLGGIRFLPDLPYYFRQYILFAVLSFIIISFMIRMNYSHGKGMVNLIFRNKLATYMGQMIYGIYLFHYPVIYYLGYSDLQHSGPAPLWVCLSALLITLGLAMISFHFIESPLLSKRKWLENKLFNPMENKKMVI